MVEVAGMECCGVKELDSLSYMELTEAGAQKAMDEIKQGCTKGGYYEIGYDYHNHGNYEGDWIEEVIKVPAFIVFTQAGDTKDVTARGAYGDYFMAFILENNLGTVVDSEPARNQNSKNMIKIFVWTVNQEAFRTWGNRPKKEQPPRTRPRKPAPTKRKGAA